MIHPEVVAIESCELFGVDWKEWTPEDPADARHALTLEIGVPGEEGTTLFTTEVVTPPALKAHNTAKRRDFRAFVVPVYDAAEVDAALRAFVASCAARSWDEVVEQLRARLRWEYER